MLLNRKALEALVALQDDEGRLTPARVVDVAKAHDHPLNRCFEWDDQIASHQYRLNQARTLIRSVEVKITTERREFSVPMFIRDPDRDQRDAGYRDIRAIKPLQDSAHIAATSELARAGAYLRRARDISEALGFGVEIVELEERVQTLRARMLADDQSAGEAVGHA